MLAGAILQAVAKNIATFIGARGIRACVRDILMVLRPLTRPAVGFGLTFGLNAAPLLITELAYPTQVG